MGRSKAAEILSRRLVALPSWSDALHSAEEEEGVPLSLLATQKKPLDRDSDSQSPTVSPPPSTLLGAGRRAGRHGRNMCAATKGSECLA